MLTATTVSHQDTGGRVVDQVAQPGQHQIVVLHVGSSLFVASLFLGLCYMIGANNGFVFCV